MRKWTLAAVITSFLVCLAGCGARYSLGAETFSSSSEALQRQTDLLSRALDGITPSDKPVHGTALVLIPSDVEIQKHYLSHLDTTSHRNQVDYLITVSKNTYLFTAAAIRKRGIFDSVSVERHNGNPASFPIGTHDYLVFADVDGWFIRSQSNPRPLLIPLDTTIPDIASRRFAFLDSLGQQAHSLHTSEGNNVVNDAQESIRK